MIKLKEILSQITESTDDDILKKSSEELVNEFGAESFNSKEDAINYINWLKQKPFPEGLANIPSEVTLYRVLAINDGGKIDEDEIGIHFVADKNIVRDGDWLEKIGVFSGIDYWEEYTYELWVLTCKVPSSNINLYETIQNRLRFPDEGEFTLKSTNGIRVMKKEKLNISNYSDYV